MTHNSMQCRHLTVISPLSTARIKEDHIVSVSSRFHYESQLTETREHPVEQLRRGKERRSLGDSVGERGVEEHGGEVEMAVICRVVVLMGTLGAGKDDNE